MYDNCKTCNDSYKEGDMNCISCKDDFYKLNETNNCYNKTLLNESFYFKDDMFYPCDDNCLTCSEGKMKFLIIVFLAIIKIKYTY